MSHIYSKSLVNNVTLTFIICYTKSAHLSCVKKIYCVYILFNYMTQTDLTYELVNKEQWQILQLDMYIILAYWLAQHDVVVIYIALQDKNMVMIFEKKKKDGFKLLSWYIVTKWIRWRSMGVYYLKSYVVKQESENTLLQYGPAYR